MNDTKMNNSLFPQRSLQNNYGEKIYQKYQNMIKCNVKGHPWDSKQDGIKTLHGLAFQNYLH